VRNLGTSESQSKENEKVKTRKSKPPRYGHIKNSNTVDMKSGSSKLRINPDLNASLPAISQYN